MRCRNILLRYSSIDLSMDTNTIFAHVSLRFQLNCISRDLEIHLTAIVADLAQSCHLKFVLLCVF